MKKILSVTSNTVYPTFSEFVNSLEIPLARSLQELWKIDPKLAGIMEDYCVKYLAKNCKSPTLQNRQSIKYELGFNGFHKKIGFQNEVFAYRISRELGFHIIPPTTFVKGMCFYSHKRSWGSVQLKCEKVIEPRMMYPEPEDLVTKSISHSQAHVLDYILGHNDRFMMASYGFNLLYDEDSYNKDSAQIYAIDNADILSESLIRCEPEPTTDFLKDCVWSKKRIKELRRINWGKVLTPPKGCKRIDKKDLKGFVKRLHKVLDRYENVIIE